MDSKTWRFRLVNLDSRLELTMTEAGVGAWGSNIPHGGMVCRLLCFRFSSQGTRLGVVEGDSAIGPAAHPGRPRWSLWSLGSAHPVLVSPAIQHANQQLQVLSQSNYLSN